MTAPQTREWSEWETWGLVRGGNNHSQNLQPRAAMPVTTFMMTPCNPANWMLRSRSWKMFELRSD